MIKVFDATEYDLLPSQHDRVFVNVNRAVRYATENGYTTVAKFRTFQGEIVYSPLTVPTSELRKY